MAAIHSGQETQYENEFAFIIIVNYLQITNNLWPPLQKNTSSNINHSLFNLILDRYSVFHKNHH